jgi:hypothetical protein
VQIQAAKRRGLDQLDRQYLAIRRHDQDVGSERQNAVQRLGVPGAVRLQDRDRRVLRVRLHRAGLHATTASGRPVRARDNACHGDRDSKLGAAARERVENGKRKGVAAEKDGSYRIR